MLYLGIHHSTVLRRKYHVPPPSISSAGGVGRAFGRLLAVFGVLLACTNFQAQAEPVIESQPANPAQGARAESAGFDIDSGDNQAFAGTVVTYQVPDFSNRDVIVMPEFLIGPSSPYPSRITVSGQTSAVYKVAVTISGMTHTFPDDLDILLVGPQGQNVVLMSDVGSGFDTPISNVNLTFDDDAPAELPDGDQIFSGTYRPSNSGPVRPDHDTFGPPAPDKPHGASLSVFEGTNPNGDWSLYVFDDSPEDTGFFAGGWALTLTLSNPIAELGAGLTAFPDPVPLTSNLVYTVSVTNRGPSLATGVTFLGELPAGTHYVASEDGLDPCVEEGGIVLCDVGDLAPGEVVQTGYQVRVAQVGSLTNTVMISSDRVDTDLSDNIAFTTASVILINDVRIVTDAAPAVVLLGQSVNYRFQVINDGPFAAGGVVLTNILPAEVEFLSVDSDAGDCAELDGIVRCELGDLLVGASRQVSIMGRATTLGSIANLAFVGGEPWDTDIANNASETLTEVLASVNLAVAQAKDRESLAAGESVVYSLTVTNQGPNAAANVSLVDTISSPGQFMQATSSQGTCTQVGNMVLCDLGEMAAGAMAMVELVVKGTSSGITTNTVQVSSEHGDPDGSDNVAVAWTVISPAADLAVRITDRPDSARVGQVVTYTMMVSNAGPDTATGVVVSNVPPAGTQFVSISSSQGGCVTNAFGFACELGTLASGGIALLSHHVMPQNTGGITNSAWVKGSQVDLDVSNNHARQSTRVLIGAGSFANDTPIEVPEFGPAGVYPSSIQVSGVTARVDQVSVTLHGLNIGVPDDLDILLVGPNGQSAILWSDAGGGTPLVNVTISLDPFANRPLPDDGAIVPAQYVPADYDPDSDAFPEPAPGPPYAAELTVFHETDVNGIWSLYVMDDFTEEASSIDGGWSLSFGTTEILNDLDLLLSLQPSPAAVDGLLTYRVQVRNHGPGPSDTVRLTSLLPPGVDPVDTGSCVVEGDLVICDLGPMVAGQTATVDIVVRPRAPGPLVFSSQVEGQATDVRYGNNSAFTSVEADHRPTILVAPFGLTVTNGYPARFQVVAEGSAPLRYQWFRDGMPLAGRTNASLTIQPTSVVDAGDYTVRIENPSGAETSPPAQLTLLNPVAITVQPSDQTAFAGGQVLFQVAATGTAPLRYQWYFEENPLPNRTAATLLVEDVDPSDAGSYRVEIMNTLGSVSSMPAHLTVLTADFGDAPGVGSGYPTLLHTDGARHVLADGVHLGQTIDSEPNGSPSGFADGDDARGIDDEDGVRFLTALVPNAEAEVEVVASTGGILDAWIDYDGDGNWNGGNERIFDGADLHGGTNRLAFIVPVEAASAEQTYARFRFSTAGGLNPYGLAMDGEVEDYAVSVVRRADLAVTLTDFPDPATVNFNLVYEIGVTNHGPLRATGVRAAAGLPPHAFLIGLSSSQGGCTALPFPACDLGELAVGDGAVMTVIVVALAQGMFTNTASVSSQEIDPDAANNLALVTTRVLERARILSPPASQAVTLGQSANFAVQASGAPLFYQWRFNDSILAGQTNATLTLDSVQLSDAGTYSVVVSNELNLLVSAPAQLTVVVPPMFITHPTSQAVPYGGEVIFTGLAEGTAPISYQWLFNGAELPGATSAELLLTELQPAQAGAYALRARNHGGEAISEPAQLTLQGAPVIIEQPANQTALAEGEAQLTVRAAGSHPLSAQWYFNGDTPLNGATDFVLNLANVQRSDAGTYHAVVTNMEGEAVSETAIVEVVAMDFGDASEPGYATTLASDGARHRIVDGLFLGATVDFEPDGAPNTDASGDDQAQDDDEDGVTFGQPWPVGQIAEIQVVASVEGVLNAWVDFNGNGAWTDAGDRIFADQLLQPGVNQLSFLVPASATARGTQARFRFSTAGGLTPTGEASDGEVEDYAVLVRHEADLVLNGSASPNPVAVGEPTTILLSVLNQGPAFASRAILTNQLPENFVLTGLAGERADTCTNRNGILVCDLGLIGSGQIAAVALEGHATTSGLLHNQAFVTSVEEDAVLDNNTSLVEITALELPSILEQPASLTLTNGAAAAFSVTAAGSMPLTYRWLRNGLAMSGATNAVLAIDGIDPGDAGNYTVRVANPVGAVNSDSATLNVLVPARIVQPPASMTVLAGSRVAWRVVAAGDEPLTYQWSRDGAPLASANSDVLVIPVAQAEDSGTYEVTVMNSLATVTSAPAELTVREADFGDAPSPGFLTMLVEDGARHYLVPGVRLGVDLDSEADGQPVAFAAGDDLIGTDDEDGVMFLTPLRAGYSANVQVDASAGGFLNAWVDFNADGDWSDPEEQIFVDRALSAGANTLAFTLPSQTVPGDSHARFRFSTTGGDGIGGLALDGEVEDHAVRLATTSDLALSGYSTPSMAAIGSTVFTSATVTNHGPGAATDVVLSDILPANWQLVSVLLSQGGCSTDGDELACNFGTISAGQAAHVLIEALPLGEGIFEELFSVGSADLDPVPSNNQVAVATMVQAMPLIVAHPRSQAASPGGNVMFAVAAIGAPPLAYQWRLNGMPLASQTEASLILADVQAEDLGTYDVVVSNPNGATTSDSVELIFADAPTLATLPAENVGATTADLVAEVTPNGLLTVVWFEWGTSEAYGNVTHAGGVGRGQQPLHFITSLGNLAAETTYHYRAVGTNDLGWVMGEGQTFVTGVLPPFITGISRQPGGSVRIEFTGKEGQPYEVRGAQILNDWTTLGPATYLGSGLFEFEDAGAVGFNARFYQIVLP